MKLASPQFLSQLEVDATTLCRLWRITPLRGGTLYFTDHDQNITYDGHEYEASESFSASAIESTVNGPAGNMSVTAFRNELIQREDVEVGIYDGADAEIDLIFYDHVEYGIMPVFAGEITGASLSHKHVVSFSLLSSTGRMQRRFMEQYSPTCRAVFCDHRCSLDIEDYGEAFTVATLTNILKFTSTEVAAHDDGYFDLGTVTWLTGDNAGVTVEVSKTLETGEVVLLIAPPYPIQIGDTGTIYRGCDKTVASCTAYENLVNFRGEPYVPGDDFTEAPEGAEHPTDSAAGSGVTPLPNGWKPSDGY